VREGHRGGREDGGVRSGLMLALFVCVSLVLQKRDERGKEDQGGTEKKKKKNRKKSLPARGYDDDPQWWSGLVGSVGWHLQTWSRGRKWCGAMRCGLILRPVPVWRTNRFKPEWISGNEL
jgi:hypothetical protein